MKYIEGKDRRQSSLFPISLEDTIENDNTVRAIDTFVNGIDMEKLGFWLIRFVLCHRFRSHCASDFGSNRAIILGSFCAN